MKYPSREAYMDQVFYLHDRILASAKMNPHVLTWPTLSKTLSAEEKAHGGVEHTVKFVWSSVSALALLCRAQGKVSTHWRGRRARMAANQGELSVPATAHFSEGKHLNANVAERVCV